MTPNQIARKPCFEGIYDDSEMVTVALTKRSKKMLKKSQISIDNRFQDRYSSY